MSRKDTGGAALVALYQAHVDLSHGTPNVTLWVDPGDSTGWAALAFGSAAARGHRFVTGQSPRLAACDQLRDVIARHRGHLTIGWEDYLLTPGNTSHHPGALKVIGFLEWACHAYPGPTILTPQPSSARLLGAHLLRPLGWHRPGERDANSAAAHLLSHLLAARDLPADLLRAAELATPAVEGEGHRDGEG